MRLFHRRFFIFTVMSSLLTMMSPTVNAEETTGEKLRALIVEGQNNHGNWPQTSLMMKGYLEQCGLFQVDIARTAPQGTDVHFHPKFQDYAVVVSNYNGEPWPTETQQSFDAYVASGGGFVVIHAANNAFADWPAYNRIIGLGGWGGRTEKHGPYVFFDPSGKEVRDTTAGPGGSHGAQHPFEIIVRVPDHPITRGMPRQWMHNNDELYDRLRGPAESMQVLATAYARPEKGGTGRHEPMLMVLEYGKGRIFHTPMGHGNDSQECVGFIASLQRGAEWAATGQVTQSIPDDFPPADQISIRPWSP